MVNKLNAFVLILLTLLSVDASSQEQLTISGKFTVKDSSGSRQKIMVSDEFDLLDTSIIKDDSFHLTCTLKNSPEFITLTVINEAGRFTQQWHGYVVGGALHFRGPDLKQCQLSGSEDILAIIREYTEIRKILQPFADSLTAIHSKHYNYNDAEATPEKIKSTSLSYYKEAVDIYRQQFEAIRKYATTYPDHYASFIGLMQSAYIFFIPTYSASVPGGASELKALFAALDPKVKQRFARAEVLQKLDGYVSSGPGQRFRDIRQPGIDGKLVDTRSMKGKVILIDLWGSWCGACREGHPHLKELYNKYHERGLEIISIAQEFGSKEDQLKKWSKAVAEDALPWLNILNKAGGRDFAKEFGIYAYPTKFLVGRDGKILARLDTDVAGWLDAKLEELFN